MYCIVDQGRNVILWPNRMINRWRSILNTGICGEKPTPGLKVVSSRLSVMTMGKNYQWK